MLKKNIPILYLVLILCGISLPTIAQENKDALFFEKKLELKMEDTTRINLLLDIAEKYRPDNIKKSEHFARQALDLSTKINSEKGLAYSNLSLGKLFTETEPDLAELFVLNSLDIARKLNDSLLIAMIYNLIGIIKGGPNNMEEALKYYNFSLNYYSRNGLDSLAAGIYNNLGLIFANQKRDSLALEYYSIAVKLNQKFNNQYWLAINYQNIGIIYNSLSLFDSSQIYYNKSLTIAQEFHLSELLPRIYNNLSLINIKMKNYQEAHRFAYLALAQLSNTNDFYQLLFSYENLKILFFDRHFLDSALFYSERINELNDSIYLHGKILGIDMLEIKDKYHEEMEINELKHKKRQLTLWLIISVWIGVSIATFFLLRLKVQKSKLDNERLSREKQMLQIDIEMKSREVTYKMLHITNQNQLITKVINTLTSRNEISSENRNAFGAVISELRLHQNLDLWKAFEKELTQLHPDFFTNLTRDYPNLTQYEKRLCAFLKLNMNSKEIADILHLNPASIVTARYRLRKKLNLTGVDENLNSIFDKY